MSADAMNDRAALDSAIADMKEARESHEKWARHLEAHDRSSTACDACTPEVVATAGDVAHQWEWVAKYDRVLSILLARRGSLRSKARGPVGESE